MSGKARLSLTVLVLAVAALLLAGGGSIGAPPPFKTDRLSVVLLEETENRANLTEEQKNVLLGTAEGPVRTWIATHGGQVRLVDVTTPPTLDEQWVQDAFKVEHASLPWLVAADSKRGASLPVTTTADALKALEPLEGK